MPPSSDPQVVDLLRQLVEQGKAPHEDIYSGEGRLPVNRVPGFQGLQNTLATAANPLALASGVATENLAIAQDLRRIVNSLGNNLAAANAGVYRSNTRYLGGDVASNISIPGLTTQESLMYQRTASRFAGGALTVDQAQTMAGAAAQSAAVFGIDNQQMNAMMDIMGRSGTVGGLRGGGGFQFDQKEFALTMAQALERGKLWDRLDDVMRTMTGLTQQAMSRGGAADPVGNMGIMATLNRATQGDRRLQEMTPNIMAMVDQGLQGAANNPLVMGGFVQNNPIDSTHTFLQRRLELRKNLESGDIGKKFDILAQTYETMGGNLSDFTTMDDFSKLSDKDIQSMEMLEKQFGFGSASNTQGALLLAQKLRQNTGDVASSQAARQRLTGLSQNADFTSLKEQSNQIAAARVAIATDPSEARNTIRNINAEYGKNDLLMNAVTKELSTKGTTFDTSDASTLSEAFTKALKSAEGQDPGKKRVGIDSDLTEYIQKLTQSVKEQEDLANTNQKVGQLILSAETGLLKVIEELKKSIVGLGNLVDIWLGKVPPPKPGSAPGPPGSPGNPRGPVGEFANEYIAPAVSVLGTAGANIALGAIGVLSLPWALRGLKTAGSVALSPRQTGTTIKNAFTAPPPPALTPLIRHGSPAARGRTQRQLKVVNARIRAQNTAARAAHAEETARRLATRQRLKSAGRTALKVAAVGTVLYGLFRAGKAHAAPIPEGSDTGSGDGEYFSPGGPVAIDPSERGGFLEDQPPIAPPVTAGARVAPPVTAGGRVAPPRTAPSRVAPAQPLTDDIEDTLDDIADTAGTALDVTEVAYGGRNAVSTYKALRAALAAKQAKNAATVAEVANAANTVRIGSEAATVAKIGFKGAASTALGGAFLANDIYNTVADEPLFDQERPSALRWAFGAVGAVTAGVLATPETFGIATVPAAIAGYGAGTALYDAGNALINKVPGWWEKGKEWVSEKLSSDKPGSLENIDTIASAAMMIEQAAVETMVVDNLVINGTQTLNAQGPNLLPQSRATAHNTNQSVTLTYAAVSEGSAGSSAYTPSDGPTYYPSGAAQAGTVALPTASLTNAALTGTSNRRVGSTVSNILIDPKTGKPVNAIVTSDMYDQRVSGSSRYLHAAYDLAVNGDTSGYGMASLTDATIAAAGQNKELGNFVTMKIGGEGANAFYVTYDHLQDPTGFKVGESVKRGQIVGKVGHTGTGGGADSHAHISGRLGGTPSNSAAEGVVGGQVVDPIAALAEFLETSGGIALPDQSQGTASGEFAKRMVAATQAARAALLTAGGSTVAASSSTVAPPSVGNFSPTVASTAAANKVELTINIKPDEKGFIKALAEASQTNNVRAEITDGRIKFTIDTTTSGAR